MSDQHLNNEAGQGSVGVTRRAALAAGGAIAATRLAGRSGLGALAASLGIGTAAFAQSAKPNIVFILADDLGWKDVGYHGSDIRTPNIDKLAETGARLEAFYAQPMCTPTRAAFLTGRYPMRYGLQTAVIPSAGQYGLDTEEFLLPQMLKDAGYKTALIGKWHLGHTDAKYWPGNRGFDYTYGPLIGEIDHFTHESHGIKDWYRNGQVFSEEGYDTELFAREAVKLIQEHDTSVPLFLNFTVTAPHTPYQAPEKYLAMYADIPDELRRAYAGQVTAMDEAVGQVVAALEAKGMRDNTLIFFVSDNGGTRSSLFVGEGKVTGELPPDNGPYRDGKGSVYEGGTRVVAVANWPGHIRPGVVEEMVHIVDIMPTLAGLAGGSTEKSKPLDGMDVWTTIAEGTASPRTEIVYNIEPYRAGVRQGDMKLVWVSLLPPSVELFDLSKDAGEKVNLAAEQPEVTAALQARALELAKEAKPPLFMMELVRLGFSHEPLFPDLGTALD